MKWIAVLAVFFLTSTTFALGVGETRQVQGKDGALIRGEAKPLSPPLARVDYQEDCVILEIKGIFARVQCGSVTGWIRTPDLMAPSALIASQGVGVPAGPISSSDVSTAGRQRLKH